MLWPMQGFFSFPDFQSFSPFPSLPTQPEWFQTVFHCPDTLVWWSQLQEVYDDECAFR